MADTFAEDENSALRADHGTQVPPGAGFSLAKLILGRLLPDRYSLLSCSLFALGVAFSALLLFAELVEGAGLRLLLANRGFTTPVTLALLALTGAAVARRLLGRLAGHRPPATGDLRRAVDILARQPDASAGLVRLGDKQVMFSDCGTAFIMYARRGRSCVALFDPVGPAQAWPGLIVKFIETARKAGCRAVFYQVSAGFLPFALDTGMKCLKFGEQAVVDIENFNMHGSTWLKLRRSVNRATRDGLEFSMLSADEIPAVLDELRHVSDLWLAMHRTAEKGFSLGRFQPEYIAAGPVAVIRMNGRIVAFANILVASCEGDACIDLMRHVPDAHRGAMDLLFVRIMERLKAEGFRTLNLGMAPLAGLATHSRAPLWNHLGNRIFLGGERYYNFQGVRAFKSKFRPRWQPRYIAVSGRGITLLAILDIALLIGGGLRGIIRKQ